MTIDPALAVALAAGLVQLGIIVSSLRQFRNEIRRLFAQHEKHETRIQALERKARVTT